MTIGERLLLETLAGHFAWLETAHPRKAARKVVKQARRSVEMSLKAIKSRKRAA